MMVLLFKAAALQLYLQRRFERASYASQSECDEKRNKSNNIILIALLSGVKYISLGVVELSCTHVEECV